MVKKLMEIKTGIKGKTELVVSDNITAESMGSGLLPVFATPYMIAMMENTCSNSMLEYMEDGWGTVGTKVDIEHLAATPVGMKVVCESELIEVDRRRLVFTVTCRDEIGEIGRGKHERFIINNEKFMAKCQEKLNK